MKLQKEFDYFRNEIAALRSQYSGKYVAISGSAVIGSGDSKIPLVRQMAGEGRRIGTFLVKRVAKDAEPIRKYRSRIY